jgi:putative FmdB family regulatory protein
MPIYAYRCSNCGHAQDVLQKISDPVLSVCPACGQTTYVKQVTAAGFQLKGSGWYVTDFRGGDAKPAKTASGEEGGKAAGKGDDKPAEATKNGDATAKSDSAGSDAAGKGGSAPAPAPATASPAPAAPSPAPSGKSDG